MRHLYLPKTKRIMCNPKFWSGVDQTVREMWQVNCPDCIRLVNAMHPGNKPKNYTNFREPK